MIWEQIVHATFLDKGGLLNYEGRFSYNKTDQVSIVGTAYPVLNNLRAIANQLYPILDVSEEHSRGFKKQFIKVFRQALNLKDDLGRTKFPRFQSEGARGFLKYGKTLCQACSLMLEGCSFT